MRRSNLILYFGILMLGLGLLSWVVTRGRPEPAPPAAEETAADEIPEIPALPDQAEAAADTEGGDEVEGLMALAQGQFESVRREGDRLAQRVWKDGLSDGQRSWLTGVGDRFDSFLDFTLSLQFLLIAVCTALILGIYHLVSTGKLQRMIRREGPAAKP